LVPQVATPWSAQIRAGFVTPAAARGSGVPEATIAQVPRPLGEAQNWQRPAQAFSQQTPSTQNPLWHCSPAVQF
jgi:hypothetical protein